MLTVKFADGNAYATEIESSFFRHTSSGLTLKINKLSFPDWAQGLEIEYIDYQWPPGSIEELDANSNRWQLSSAADNTNLCRDVTQSVL